MGAGTGRRGDRGSRKFYQSVIEEFGNFAAFQFQLSAPQDDGLPLRAHLESYERQTGKVHSTFLDAPELPWGCEQLWADFLSLHDSRGSAGFGPARITWRDLADWQHVNGAALEHWQIAAIRKADDAFLADWAERQPKAKQ